MEPVKPPVIKLQERNSDIYEAFKMIEKEITDIKHPWKNIDHEFDHCYELTHKMFVEAYDQERKPRQIRRLSTH